MKKTLAVAAALLAAGSLTACGGDDNNASSNGGGGYCDQLEDLRSSMNSLDDFTALTDEQFADFQSSLDDIESAAPDSVKDDWASFNDTLDQVKDILDDAGLSFADIQAMQDNPGELPDDIDIAKLQEFAQRMQEVSSTDEFTDAANAIQQNVQDECGIDLDETTESGS